MARDEPTSALAMPAGPTLASGTSRAWRLKSLLIVPFIAVGGIATGAETESLLIGFSVTGAILLGGLIFNAFLLLSDGTFTIEPRRLVFRTRSGFKQAWAFQPGLVSGWSVNFVNFGGYKALHTDRDPEPLCALLDQLCAPELHGEVHSDVVCVAATLLRKGAPRSGAVVLLPMGAYFVEQSDGDELLGALVGKAPVGWPVSALAVSELVPQRPAELLEARLAALAVAGPIIRWNDFRFALESRGDGLSLVLRRQEDRVEAAIPAATAAAVKQLSLVWRSTFARLD